MEMHEKAATDLLNGLIRDALERAMAPVLGNEIATEIMLVTLAAALHDRGLLPLEDLSTRLEATAAEMPAQHPHAPALARRLRRVAAAARSQRPTPAKETEAERRRRMFVLLQGGLTEAPPEPH